MAAQSLFGKRQSTTEVTHTHRHLGFSPRRALLFRLIEVTLSSQMNSLPFHLHVWSTRSCMDELENCANRYYHLEEIALDEINLGKDCELIPVAHYTRVNRERGRGELSRKLVCVSGNDDTNEFTEILSIPSESDTRRRIVFQGEGD